MWKYNHTNEMYTGRYDRSEKLYHSDVYLGQDYSDGIQHFKYIKREKVNGKWVYYYKDDLLDKEKAKYNKYVETANAAAAERNKVSKKTKNILNNYYKAEKETTKYGVGDRAYRKKIPNKIKNQLAKKYQEHVENKHVKELHRDVTLANKEGKARQDASFQKLAINSAKYKDEKRKKAAKKVVKFLNKLSNAGYKVKKTLDTKALEALSKGHIKYGTTVKKNKTGFEDVKVVQKSDKLLSDSNRLKFYGTGWESKDETYNIGKIDQAIDKKKKKLYNKYKKKYEKTYGKTK